MNVGLDLFWRLRPSCRLARHVPLSDNDPHREEASTLRAIIQRFPFWRQGRALLAEKSIVLEDIATAYAEAQALRLLSTEGAPSHALALALLGRCYLKRGDGASALSLLTQASNTRPNDYRILEDQAAAHVLLRNKTLALEILQGIPKTHLSAEGKAAIQWLSMQS